MLLYRIIYYIRVDVISSPTFYRVIGEAMRFSVFMQLRYFPGF